MAKMDVSGNERSTSQPDHNKPGRDDYRLEELRELILGKEREQINELLSRIEDPDKFSDEVSKAIHLAITKSHESGNQLSDSLFPVIEKAILKSVKKDSQPLVDAIFPIMGPAIRKSIAETFRAMIQSMNMMLESSLSARGMQLRAKSLISGKSYAELVLLHNLIYSVQHIFLIHRETGLLICEVHNDQAQLQDADMVASMLKAISDFVQDSFSTSPQDSLDTIEVGDQTVWIVQGPYALIAAVVKGETPENLRIDFQMALEQIHLGYSEELKDFEGETATFQPIEEVLSPCLKTYEKKQKKKKPYWSIALISIVFVALALWGYSNYTASQKWSDYIERLNSVPGIIVAESEKNNGKYYIFGLKDRLSEEPIKILDEFDIDSSKVVSSWDTYSSLSHSIIQIRIDKVLAPPATVACKIIDDTLVVTGSANHKWIKMLNKSFYKVTGINHLNTENLEDSDLDEMLRLKEIIENMALTFNPGEVDIVAGSTNNVDAVLEGIEYLRTFEPDFTIDLYGQTDASGTAALNDVIALQRAMSVKKLLEYHGIPEEQLNIRNGNLLIDSLGVFQNNKNRRTVVLKIKFRDLAN